MNLCVQGQPYRFTTSIAPQTPTPLPRKASFLGFNAYSLPHHHPEVLNDFYI